MRANRLIKAFSALSLAVILQSVILPFALAAKNIDGTNTDGGKVQNTSALLIVIAACVAVVLIIVAAIFVIKHLKAEYDLQKITELQPVHRNKQVPLSHEEGTSDEEQGDSDEEDSAESEKVVHLEINVETTTEPKG